MDRLPPVKPPAEELKQTLEPAIRSYSAAIQYAPYDADTFAKLADCYARSGYMGLAFETLAKAIMLNPDSAYAYTLRAALFSGQDDTKNSISDYTRAIEIKPNFLAYICYLRSKEWLRLRDWENAKSDLIAAMNNGLDIIAKFRDIHGSLDDFEQKYGVKLPPD